MPVKLMLTAYICVSPKYVAVIKRWFCSAASKQIVQRKEKRNGRAETGAETGDVQRRTVDTASCILVANSSRVVVRVLFLSLGVPLRNDYLEEK